MTTSVPKFFKSTDTSAPQLTGQTGSILAILQACLIGTSGVAYGSGGSAKSAVGGWTNPFTNTSTKGVFQNSLSAGGVGSYHRILDDGSGAAGFKEAFLTSYQSMSTIDVGTNVTPPTATLANGWAVVKSNTADSTSRPWFLVADEVTCYFWIAPNEPSGTTVRSLYCFGDFSSDVPGDTYRYVNVGKPAYNSSIATTGFNSFVIGSNPAVSTANGCAIGADYNLTGNAIIAAGYSFNGGSNPGYTAGVASPAPGTGLNLVTPGWLYTNTAGPCFRGRFRGLYVPMNNITSVITSGTAMTTSNLPSGTQLVPFTVGNPNSGTISTMLLDITNAWSL